MKLINLFFGNYLRAGLFVIILAIGWFCWHFVHTNSFVKDSVISEFEKQGIKDKNQVAKLDSTIFSITQNLDICNDNKTKREIVISELTKQRNDATLEAKRVNEALEHYEKNGLMRYFVKKPLSKWYEEVFEKPQNIRQ